jgi:phosphate/sulfate permease
VRSMALAWVVTLPAAALLGAGFHAVMSIAAR